VPNYDQYLTPDAIVIYPHRGRVLLLIVGATVAVALSFFAWRTGDEIEYRVAGVAGIVFFGFGLIYFLMRLARPRPALIITGSGMVDNASALASGFVRWDEIAAFSIVKVQHQPYLAISLNNPNELLQRQPSIKASVMRINMRLFGTPILIPRTPLPMTLEELIDRIRQKCPANLVE
jgi:formate-dependent nitrite reductase membrane component NrfD